MTAAMPVAHSRLSPPQLAGLSDAQRQRLLGVISIGGPAEDWHGELPVQHIAAPLLGRSAGALNEIWYSGAKSCRAGEFAGIRFRVDDNVLYGVIDLEEANNDDRRLPLQHAAEDAYRRIFALLDRESCPHLWRTWNYLADINVEQDGLERYRQFNIGRHDAFVGCGRLTRGNAPAACALGTTRGPLTIAFMAGRTAATPIENPRQVSAYHYPDRYGPRSPTFSRAAFAQLPGQELLFISGTASIVGHQTLHVGDVAGQTRETLANIAALLDAANAHARTRPYTLAELNLRAYIRRAEDYQSVQELVARQVGADAPVIYVQADICREDLLVEIEAMASHTLGNC
jgi:enamine deaminase RidA (YjgF/YER057c/UK114 family)